MKTLLNFISVLLIAAFTALSLEIGAGVPPAITFFSSLGIAVGLSMLPAIPGVAFMGLQVELWTGELIKGFRSSSGFLSRIGSKDQYVVNNTIHLAQIGVDPKVLINNTTYPIASAVREDSDVPIGLDKFDTENTIITDDELHGLPYDKPGSVIEQHREVLQESTADKAIHSLCPAEDTDNTPVFFTTGDSNGYTNPRKRATVADIIKLKKALDDLKVPLEGRELVFCSQHVEDLLLTNQAFKEQWYNTKSGVLMDMFGFIISQYVTNPKFVSTTLKKKAFGAAAAAATDLEASVVYYNKRAVQATGTATMYHAKAADNPQFRQSVIGFRLHHLCLPKSNVGFGALVSTKVS